MGGPCVFRGLERAGARATWVRLSVGPDNLVDVSSLALYRRYRPESFAEVIGQEHVTDPLQQALRNNRVNHAYLFSGPRGCGKTTSARILARCLNCEQGPTPTPCGECQSCRDLARNGPGSIDVIEIDAASHGGVDDARDLREKAFFGPASSRYKIYIIDEAHMVTPAGFNALLKVVEEPPEHLKFIFATTEPEKVIGTIRSRTHHYPFRLVPPGTLRSYLADVCGRENSPVEDGVLPLVVRAGAGSVRDSMSVMDQLLAGAGDDGVTYAMATSLLGYTDGSLLDSIIDAFAAGDGAAAFEVVERVIEGGNDPRRFVADLLERLRDLVILAAVPDAGEKGLIDAPADVVERMQAQASVFGAAELSRAADLVNDGLTEMRGATSPRLQVELICARVLLPAAYDDERSLQARLDRLERGASAAAAASFAAPPAGAAPMGYVPGPEAHVPQAHAPVAPAGPDAARAAVRGEAPPPATPAPAAYATPAPAQAYPPAPQAPAPQAPRRLPPSPPSGPGPGPPPQEPDPEQEPGTRPVVPAAGPPRPPPAAARPPPPPRRPRPRSPRPRRPPWPRPRPRAARAWPRARPRCGTCGRTSWRRSRAAVASPGSCSARTPRSPGSTARRSSSASSTPAPVTTSRAAAARRSSSRPSSSASTPSGASKRSSTPPAAGRPRSPAAVDAPPRSTSPPRPRLRPRSRTSPGPSTRPRRSSPRPRSRGSTPRPPSSRRPPPRRRRAGRPRPPPRPPTVRTGRSRRDPWPPRTTPRRPTTRISSTPPSPATI
ncbi:DNA polymerase III subunit gamma and tau [Streptomyces griseus]|uniref:DNA polymerase III subunit gamma and tau n=1 Tax=Streptomyces griseus TaxID=1911 RepID=UPI003F637D04